MEVGSDFYWVLRGACRAAGALGQPEIEASSVIVSLMNSFPAFRSVLRPSPVAGTGAILAAGFVEDFAEITPVSQLELLRV